MAETLAQQEVSAGGYRPPTAIPEASRDNKVVEMVLDSFTTVIQELTQNTERLAHLNRRTGGIENPRSEVASNKAETISHMSKLESMVSELRLIATEQRTELDTIEGIL